MTKTELQNLVIDYADAYSIDRAIALAQIGQESRFNPSAIGSSGERGLGQFMPGTWARFGQGSFDNAFNSELNLTAWGAYMQWLLDRYGWDYSKALMGYNGGEGNVDRGTVSSAAQNYAMSILRDSEYTAPINLSPVADSLPSNDSTIFGLSFTTAFLIGLGLVLVLRK